MATERKRTPVTPDRFHTKHLARYISETRNAGTSPEDGPAGRPGEGGFCSVNSTIVARLVEGYARERKKDVIRQIADASRLKGVTFPAALSGPNDTLIDMTTLVTHTGQRFLNRADLCSPDNGGGIKPLCPPDADAATKRQYASDATAALVEIMNGSPPPTLKLDAIADLLEQAQYFEAVFIAVLLPYYFQPLATQLKPQKASKVLVTSLSAVQGADATHAYKLMVQALAPCIASTSVSERDFSAAALQIVRGAQALWEATKDTSCEVYELLLELAGGLADFEPFSLPQTKGDDSTQAAGEGAVPDG